MPPKQASVDRFLLVASAKQTKVDTDLRIGCVSFVLVVELEFELNSAQASVG